MGFTAVGHVSLNAVTAAPRPCLCFEALGECCQGLGQVPQSRKTNAEDSGVPSVSFFPTFLPHLPFTFLSHRPFQLFTQCLRQRGRRLAPAHSGNARPGLLVMKRFRYSPRIPSPVRSAAAVYIRSPGN